MRVHHVNLLVRDLDRAVERIEKLLGAPVDRIDELPARGARTARFRLGELWLILVSPTGPGVPADRLESHGEGLFLLSLDVDDLDGELERLAEAGFTAPDTETRTGLDGWRVADLNPEATFGVPFHLTEAKPPARTATSSKAGESESTETPDDPETPHDPKTKA